MNAFICLILYLSLFDPNSSQTTKTNESLTEETTVTSVMTSTKITENQFTGNETFLSTELTLQSTAENLNASDVSNVSETTTNEIENRKKIINALPDKDGGGVGPTDLPVSGSLKPLIIAIILFLGFLLFIACILIYWFCIRKKAPRDDVSADFEEPKGPEDKKESQSSSEQLDPSIRSENV